MRHITARSGAGAAWRFDADGASLFVFIVSLAVVVLLTPPALANGAACVKSCKLETRRCIGDECTGLRGKARRKCRETCRGRGGCTYPPIGTLAYVVSECRVLQPGSFIHRQSLHVRRGNCDPVRISYCVEGENAGRLCMQDADCEGGVCGEFLEPPEAMTLSPGCRALGRFRLGNPTRIHGIFQRIGVSPDGSTVLFEVASSLGLFDLAPPEIFEPFERLGTFGTYSVRADGNGLRRLGRASEVGPWDQVIPEGVDLPFGGYLGFRGFSFSPNGRTVVLTDVGPTETGEDAFQVVTLDPRTGRRTVLTELPPVLSPFPPTEGHPRLGPTPAFIDDETIVFFARAQGDGPNLLDGRYMKIRADGRGGPRPVPTPDSGKDRRIDPGFSVLGGPRNVLTLSIEEKEAEIDHPLAQGVAEVFFNSGKNLLQLTDFCREETRGRSMGFDLRHAFFVASVNLEGKNPKENCQLFSADVVSGRIRQLTRFEEEGPAPDENGCVPGPLGYGCTIGTVLQDPGSGTLLFTSSCDPFERNPNGEQIFAIRPDGSGLTQLTNVRGMTELGGDSVEVELPGPWAYSTPAQQELAQ